MKDVVEELKSLRNSESKETLKLSDLESIANSMKNKTNDFLLRKQSALKRVFPEHYSSFECNGIPSIGSLMEETLFYIFYAFINTKIQIEAYNELIKKGYAFSKTLDLFVYITENKIVDNLEHSIIVFLPLEWKKEHRKIEFTAEFISGLEFYINSE